MARRAAAKGTRRPRKPSPPSSVAGGEDGAAEGAHTKAAARGSGGGFFCCYLLRSLCPRLKGRTYIGFTVNPRRRIRQHNGEISSGAWRTRRGRPWEMVLCIHGFPTNVAALQFEWAWQHPKESLAVRKAASGFKSLSGAGNKVKLAYAMLNLPSWENLNLTVNFFSSTSAKFATGCPPLPSQMKTVVCPMEDLQCHAEAISGDLCDSSQGNDIDGDPQGHQGPESLHEDQEQPMDAQTRTAICYVEEDNYSSDDFASMEWDGILDLTEQDESRTLPQCHQGPDLLRSDEQSEHSWKQSSSDQVQPIDAQSRTAVYDVEEDNYSGDDFAPAEWDEILDLTEPNRSRTSPQCSLSSNSDDGSVVEGELGQTSPQTSPMWKVVCAGSDGGVLEDELGQAVSPAWKACSGSDAVNDELVQASPVLKVGADSDCHDRGVTNDELGQASPMLMIDAGSDEGKRDMVVDLVTPTPVGRLRRRAGAGSICHRIIDLTASPAVIEL